MDLQSMEYLGKTLIWFPEKGLGFYPVRGFPYDEAYFKKYKGYEKTRMGRAIQKARCHFVKKYEPEQVIDIGAGCGTFIKTFKGNIKGYDVNPVTIRWLKKRGLWFDIEAKDSIESACFWDSLEHIQNLPWVLGKIKRWVFISIPLFSGLEHILQSKHYRKDEHFWYFTEKGLCDFMRAVGFKMREHNEMETELGREDIHSFVFERI